MESMDRIRPDEPAVGINKEDTPVMSLMARVLERENLKRALKQVIRNKGAPGIPLCQHSCTKHPTLRCAG